MKENFAMVVMCSVLMQQIYQIVQLLKESLVGLAILYAKESNTVI
jgi:hypothetical protein